jgi:hypothetical protein
MDGTTSDEKYIMYVRFVKAPLYEMFKTLGAVTDLVKFVCKRTHISIDAINVARSVCVSLTMNSPEEYKCSLPVEYTIPLKVETLNIMLSNAKKTDKYVAFFVLRSTPTVFHVEICDSEHHDGLNITDEYFFNIDEDDMQSIEKLRDQNHAFQAIIDSAWLKAQLASVHRLRDTKVDITYDQDGDKNISLIMEAWYAESQQGKRLHMCNTKDSIMASDPSLSLIIRGTYCLADLTDVASCPADNKKVILYIAQSDGSDVDQMMPLVLSYCVTGIGTVKFSIKPSTRDT